MKTKTINKVIKAKIDDWLSSIEDGAVRELAKKNVIVTGGCIASMLLREPVNDYDIYFRTREATLAVAHYYVKRFQPKNRRGIPCRIYLADEFGAEVLPSNPHTGRIRIVIKSAGIASENGSEKPYEYFESSPEGQADGYVSEIMTDSGAIEDRYEETEDQALQSDHGDGDRYRPVFMSTNAITLSGKIQIVIRFFGSPDEIHENYDFVHCTNYWDGALTLRQPALEAILTKELRYVGSRYPVCSVIRLRKFIKRNWTINAGQILKMLMQVNELNLKDIKVLEDQLTGVDAAYFCEVISKLKEADPEKINSAYLIEIIDRMF